MSTNENGTERLFKSALSEKQLATLDRSVPKSAMKSRPDGGYKYVQKGYVYETLNEIFGVDNWDLVINSMEVVHQCDAEISTGKNQPKVPGIAVTAVAHVRLTIKQDGIILATKENVGSVTIGAKLTDKGTAYENAYKGAVTDAAKRAASMLGDRLGMDIEAQKAEDANVAEDADAPLSGAKTAAPAKTASAPTTNQASPQAQKAAVQPANTQAAQPAAQPAQQAQQTANTGPTARPAVAQPATTQATAGSPTASPAPAAKTEAAPATTSPSIAPANDSDNGIGQGSAVVYPAGANENFLMWSKKRDEMFARIDALDVNEMKSMAQHNMNAIKAYERMEDLHSAKDFLERLVQYNNRLKRPHEEVTGWVKFQVVQINTRMKALDAGVTPIDLETMLAA